MEDKYRDTPGGMSRLSTLREFEVASDSPDIRGWDVATIDQRTIGTVDDLIVDTSEMKARYMLVGVTAPLRADGPTDDDHHILVPLERARVDEAGHQVRLDVTGASAQTMPRFTGTVPADFDDRFRRDAPAPPAGDRGDGDAARITRAAEELKIGRRQVPAGEVSVSKHVETEHVHEPVQRMRENVKVERRPASGHTPGGELKDEHVRVPITEEEVVVEKRPVVKEEIVISKEARPETIDVEADVRKERVDVDRTDTDKGSRPPRSRRG